MYRHTDDSAGSRRFRGLTLIELLIAMSIMAMVVGTLGALAHGVQLGYEYTEGHGLAVQHARVVLERISRRVEECTAGEQFPGFLVVPQYEGGVELPEMLVVWHPSGTASDPNGLPRYNELVLYTPNAYAPNQLLEVTIAGDTRTVPPPNDLARWRSELASLRNTWRWQAFPLTSLLRVCRVSGALGNAQGRGAVRFQSRLRPSEADWARYQSGDLEWSELPWVRGIYGSRTGLRQAALQIELQLMPGDVPVAADAGTHTALPFFGAAARYYPLER